VRFNPGAKMVLNSYLSANYEVTSSWSVSTSLGVSVPFTALTDKSKSFSKLDALNQIAFPLSIDGGVFTGGVAYSFRLTVSPTANSKIVTYTEVVLTANSPPTGGYISATPSSGTALVTNFQIATPGWTADVSVFPLSFNFAYRSMSSAPYLTLAAPSLRAFTTSALPAGSSSGGLITVQGTATDVLLSSSSAIGSVTVTASTSTNITSVLLKGLSKAFASGNLNLAFQTVNNVSILYIMLHFLSHFVGSLWRILWLYPYCLPHLHSL
jgi:REJ domain